MPAFSFLYSALSEPGGGGHGPVGREFDETLDVPVDVPEPGGHTQQPGEGDADEGQHQREADHESQHRVPEGADHPGMMAGDHLAVLILNHVVDDEGHDAE